MLPAVFGILQDGLVSRPGSPEDTFERLWKLQSLQISTDTEGGGEYLHLYRDAKIQRSSGTTSINAWYNGQTSNFGNRYKDHDYFISSPNEPYKQKNHYEIARSASNWRAIKMFEIPSDIPDKEELCTIAEQYMILVLHSTHADLLLRRTPTEIEALGPWFTQAFAAQELAQCVFQKTGWQTTMPSVIGANWSMPMREFMSYASIPWTRTLFPLATEISEKTEKAIFTAPKQHFSPKQQKEKKGESGVA